MFIGVHGRAFQLLLFFSFLKLGAADSAIVHRRGHGSVAFWTQTLGWWIKGLATLSAELVSYGIFGSAV